MSKKKEITKVLIENDEGKFLVLQSSDLKEDKWELPGGKIKEDLGEDRLDAARRETREETTSTFMRNMEWSI